MEKVSNNPVVDLSVGDRKSESSDNDTDRSWRIKVAKEEKLWIDSESIGLWREKLARFERNKRMTFIKFEVQSQYFEVFQRNVVRSWTRLLVCGIGRRVGKMVEGRVIMRDAIKNTSSRKVGGLVRDRFKIICMTYVDSARGGEWGADLNLDKGYLEVAKGTEKIEIVEGAKKYESMLAEQVEECKLMVCSLMENIRGWKEINQV